MGVGTGFVCTTGCVELSKTEGLGEDKDLGENTVCEDSSQTLECLGLQTQFLSLLGTVETFLVSLDEEEDMTANMENRAEWE